MAVNENKQGAALMPGFMKQQPAVQQMKTLGGVFVILLVAIAILVYNTNRDAAHGTAYVAAAGEMRMLSQRMAKASTLALQGNPVAFAQLKESRETFSQLLDRVTSGGEVAGTSVPPSPLAVRPQLEALATVWSDADKDALVVIGQEANLLALGKSVATIDTGPPRPSTTCLNSLGVTSPCSRRLIAWASYASWSIGFLYCIQKKTGSCEVLRFHLMPTSALFSFSSNLGLSRTSTILPARSMET